MKKSKSDKSHSRKGQSHVGARYAVGLDYGTNSVRALVVNVANGEEVGTAVCNYPSGSEGILLDPRDHNLARQSPLDYVKGLQQVVVDALKQARHLAGVTPDQIVGLGVDTTGSTPIPVDDQNRPMCLRPEFKKNLNAYAWLWKDHTAYREAAAITEAAKKNRPQYLAKCGGVYSSEWYWSKVLHCLNVDPVLFDAAYAWIEMEDYIPAVLCGVEHPEAVVRGVCAAGHKAMYNPRWGGMPDAEFLSSLHPKLARVRERIAAPAAAIDHQAGRLTAGWAAKLGLKPGIPVAVGAFDAHLGAVGSGIKTGTLVKIVGTSTCDIMAAKTSVPDITGVCGIVEGSVLPGYFGIEAGQSAVGDIFRWFVKFICQGNDRLQVKLTEEARALKPGASGLMALDWNNGNRTILVDPQLTGLLVGMTLHTSRVEIYRALLEATAFGALTIINRIEEYGIPIERVVCCGGISEKNDLFMQIYADVLNRPMYISRSAQTCALGAAIAGALAAGAHPSIESAIEAMTGVKKKVYRPIPGHVAVYRELYVVYKTLHDAFGVSGAVPVTRVMKELLKIKAKVLGI
ncbi:MAG: ribulokinase [Verrucomicrobia bacterium]|nr:ribulokinase [Verrucomicrobiota bacterium]MBU4291252.1 ribulokinase [Verrucomicrobiota bacterium]MBU4429890.1 ribulokinase [Verrucomicrobiota bacterium]MCG2678703.1 ribulokinase [Kiritimatiellia bacterium]